MGTAFERLWDYCSWIILLVVFPQLDIHKRYLQVYKLLYYKLLAFDIVAIELLRKTHWLADGMKATSSE